MGNKIEAGRRQEGSPNSRLTFSLTYSDLLELALRLKQTAAGYSWQKGNISIPRSKIIHDHETGGLIRALQELGRVIVVEKIPRVLGSQASGSTVVYFNDNDYSAGTVVRLINAGLLAPLLNFFRHHPSSITGAEIFPNISPHGIKGLALTLSEDQKNWSGLFSQLNWSLGRGLQIAALRIDPMAFIENSQDILLQVYRAAATGVFGGIKYVQFLSDQQGAQLYVAVAAGPTSEEKTAIGQRLTNSRPSDRDSTLGRIRSFYSDKRAEIMAKIAEILGADPAGIEQLTDLPYIDGDINNGLLVSGGTLGPNNGLSAFFHGGRYNIFPPAEATVMPMPIGTRIFGDYNPQLPSGLRISFPDNDMGAANTFFGIKPDEMTGLKMQLDVLALGFHTDLRPART